MKKLSIGFLFHRLISKLYIYNINEDIITWIEAYIENRVQRVKINSYFSNWANVVSDIPRGSILGPLLFIICINELPDICESGSTPLVYADDAKIDKQYPIDDRIKKPPV